MKNPKTQAVWRKIPKPAIAGTQIHASRRIKRQNIAEKVRSGFPPENLTGLFYVTPISSRLA
jgi:hypothetical protein